ncbi:MAG TPA: signal peptidase I [Terracidiphilus sp.]|nr:signal peptidase I [Terracidiphilus sp.]
MDSTQQERPASISNDIAQPDSFQPNSAALAPTRRSRGALLLWVRDVAVSAVASILFILFLYQPVRVEGTSMMPRLENHDRLFINKFVYHFEAINRGDVVVFHYPLDPSKSYIKRVIGLPGDRIQIIHGRVWLNGKMLREPYVPTRYRENDSMAAMTVPKDCYFVMGDHRSISSDSRAFGPVERSLIYGKAEFIYWPAKDAGVVH